MNNEKLFKSTKPTTMPYFKINHEHELDWDGDDNDLSTFIIVAVKLEPAFRFSTHVPI